MYTKFNFISSLKGIGTHSGPVSKWGNDDNWIKTSAALFKLPKLIPFVVYTMFIVGDTRAFLRRKAVLPAV